MADARFVSILTQVALVAVLTVGGCTYTPYRPAALAFSGDSSQAQKTVVVPTPDSPLPQGVNAIWCPTLQLCWNDLKPIIGDANLPEAADIVRLLNISAIDHSDLPEGCYYAAAGSVSDGIVEKIKADMAEQFPLVCPSLPPDANSEAFAYAYLAAAVKFRTPYFDREGGDDFVDSSGTRSRVSSFGLYRNRESSVNKTLGRQIEVLYSDKDQCRPAEFVLDLDSGSRPTQLILACVQPEESLAATWEAVQRKVTQWQPAQDERKFGDSDSLVVPNVDYRITHSIKELETSGLLRTMQTIEFRLDRSGAALASEAFIAFSSAGRSFGFTRPFLIAMRKRGSAKPYFLMWVDNAELLCKQPAD